MILIHYCLNFAGDTYNSSPPYSLHKSELYEGSLETVADFERALKTLRQKYHVPKSELYILSWNHLQA